MQPSLRKDGNLESKRKPKNEKKTAGSGKPDTTLQLPKSTQIERGMPLFPVGRIKKFLRYADTFSVSTGAGVAGTYVFTANGLYDPDITGTGHQPAGFDQMMLSYNHYMVVNSRMIATFVNSSTANLVNCAIRIAADSTPLTNINQIIEDGIVTRDLLNLSPAPNSLVTLEKSVNIRKIQGGVSITDNTDLQGNAAANPLEQTYFHVSVWNSRSLAMTSVSVDVCLEFEAWFYEPRNLTQSLRNILFQELAKDTRTHALREELLHVKTHASALLQDSRSRTPEMGVSDRSRPSMKGES
jgi:hypothetical protein